MIMTVRDTIASIKPSNNNEFTSCATEGGIDAPIDDFKRTTVYSVQGIALKVYGEQTRGIELDGGLRGTMRVTVRDASESGISPPCCACHP